MIRILLAAAVVFLSFLLATRWKNWMENRDMARPMELEKEFRESIENLIEYLDNFKLPIGSEEYQTKLSDAINANKKLLIDARLNPYPYKYIKGVYELALDNLLNLKVDGIDSLYERRITYQIFHEIIK